MTWFDAILYVILAITYVLVAVIFVDDFVSRLTLMGFVILFVDRAIIITDGILKNMHVHGEED